MWEWNDHQKLFSEYSIKLLNLNFNYFKFLPKEGYINSRLSYFLIYILSFIPLIKLLRTHQPNIVFLHLITSLPLTILKIFNFKTDFALRISGYPKFNFIRKFFGNQYQIKLSL